MIRNPSKVLVCAVHHSADFIVECEIHDNGPSDPPELVGLRMRIDAAGSPWEPYDEACRLDERAIDVGLDIADLTDRETSWGRAFRKYVEQNGADK